MRTTTRLVTMLLSVALMGLPALVLGAGPASAVETWQTRVQIESAPPTQIYGRRLQVAAALEVQDPSDGTWFSATSADGEFTLHLERRAAGTADFTEVASLLADEDGVVVFDLVAEANATYRVRYDGQDYSPELTLAPAMSAEKVSKVMRALNARDIERRGKVYLKGNVDPGWGNKPIVLQRKTCKSCGWKSYDKTRTSSTGGWKFHTPVPRKGSWWYRAKVAGTTDFVTSYSATLRVWTEYYRAS
jgi:hypothetical protein